jgi:hypothetical protein
MQIFLRIENYRVPLCLIYAKAVGLIRMHSAHYILFSPVDCALSHDDKKVCTSKFV